MVFVIDIDDTICDSDKYSEEYILKFFKENNLPYKKIRDISRFAEGKFDWDMETANNWYKNYGDDMMLEFPCKPFTVEILNRLHDEGHKIIIATARANDWHNNPVLTTNEWLKNSQIQCDKLIIGRKDKEQICLEEKADIFIDDDIKLCEKVYQNCSNTLPLLLLTSYNKTQEINSNINKINDFRDIFKFIKSI